MEETDGVYAVQQPCRGSYRPGSQRRLPANRGIGGPITMWGYWDPTGANGQVLQANLLKKWTKLFEQASPGSTVNYSYVPYDQMDSKLISAATARTGPDVVLMGGSSTASDALGGSLADSTAFFRKSGLLKAYPAVVEHSLKGKYYSIQPYVNLDGIMYNATILSKLHLSVPTNYTQFLADMKAAKVAGYWGLTLTASPDGEGEFDAHPWLTNAGFDFAHPTMSALVAGLSYAQQWVAAGYVSKETSTFSTPLSFSNWMAGKTLFYQGGNWNIGAATAGAKFKWGDFAMPLGPRG